ncbi:MAG TPA: ATP-binding protein [Chryseosolibacter sp.]
MAKTLLFAVLTFAFFLANAQKSTITLDSAILAYENGNAAKTRYYLDVLPDKTRNAEKVLLACRLEAYQGYFLKSIAFGKQAREEAKQLGEASVEASAILEMAISLIEIGQTDSILFLAEQAEQLDTVDINAILLPLVRARYWHSLNQPAKALPFYQKALDHAIESDALRHRIQIISWMGGLYFSLEPNMKRVIALLMEAIELSDSSKHADLIARNSARLANANMVLGNLERAEAYLNRAKRITDITHNMPVESYVLSSFAILRAIQGNIAESIQIAAEPIRMKREMGQVKALQNDLLNMAEWQMELKQYAAAEKTINEGIATSTALKDYVYLTYYYRHLSTLDSLTGKFANAYSHLKQAMVFNDSTIALQNAKAVNEIREKYEAGQKEKLLAEKELEIQEQRNRVVLILSVAVIAVLAMAIVILVIRNRHKIRLDIEKQEQNKLRLQTIINTQEEVQQDIARDIHDGLVQMMGAAKLSLQAIRPGEEVKSLLEKTSRASAIIDDACMEARNISHQLLPYSLMREGFSSALREQVKSSFATYSFEGDDAVELDQKIAINLFRISQEIINNIVKHADATFVKVVLKTSSQNLSLTFEDNGRGFDAMKVTKGAGLVNIMTRAEVIGATVEISSQPGKGTVTNISVAL